MTASRGFAAAANSPRRVRNVSPEAVVTRIRSTAGVPYWARAATGKTIADNRTTSENLMMSPGEGRPHGSEECAFGSRRTAGRSVGPGNRVGRGVEPPRFGRKDISHRGLDA